jgi:energy-converting hydrogenase B subunit D
MITTFRLILLISLVICAVATAIVKKPMQAIIIYMAYSVIMSVIWMLLESPDLAITEAAVGAGVTGILFFVTLHRINLIDKDAAYDEEMESHRKKEGEGEQDAKRDEE